MNSESSLFSAHWLARFPVTLFAIPYGLLGLAGAWRRGEALGWPAAAMISRLILWPSVALWAALIMVYGLKCLRHPKQIGRECAHPVQGAVMGALPLSTLLVIINLGQPGSAFWLSVTILTLALQAVVIGCSTWLIVHGRVPTELATPALYLPGVGGGLIGAICLATLQYPIAATLLFGFGVASWFLLETRMLTHLYRAPMPPTLRPTIGVELAPACVTTLTAAVLWPTLPPAALLTGLGFAMWPLLTILLRYRWWVREPFAPGFWSFSFPLAALASVALEAARRGALPGEAAVAILLLASAVIAFLTLRTIILLTSRKLIPAAA